MAEDSLLREVDDAVRHDQMMALWRKYRQPLLAASIALIVASGGGSLWRDYKEREAGAAMAELMRGQNLYAQGKFTDAEAAFAATADRTMSGDVHDLAHFWQAKSFEKAGQPDKAIALLEEVANHPDGHDLMWRDLACLRLAGLDESKATCLGEAGDSPFANERALLQAAHLWKQGHADQAAEILSKLANDTTLPEPVRTRAQFYLSVVKSDAKK